MQLILDTMILLYLRGPSHYRTTRKSRNILRAVRNGLHIGMLTAPVLMELYYKLSDSDDQQTAKDFIRTILATPNIMPIDTTKDMGIFAGELYFKYNTSVKKLDPEAATPSACDCLIASVNRYVDDSVVCTNDNKIKDLAEINSDFLGIPTH